MPSKRPKDSSAEFEKKRNKKQQESYVLRLYVTNTTPNSVRAIKNLQEICEKYFKGRYSLEVVDVYQQPALAKGEQIIAAPTLIKKFPCRCAALSAICRILKRFF